MHFCISQGTFFVLLAVFCFVIKGERKMKEATSNILIGLDNVTLNISCERLVKDVKYIPKENNCVIQAQPHGSGTQLAICLPRALRPGLNTVPFQKGDCVSLRTVLGRIRNLCETEFGSRSYFENAVVKSVECGFTVIFSETEECVTINNLMRLFQKALLPLDKKKPQQAWHIGKKRDGCAYVKRDIVQSFSLPQDSCNRYSLKVYSKGIGSEQGERNNIKDGVLRYEHTYGQIGLEFVFKQIGKEHILCRNGHNDRILHLEDVLQEDVILGLIEQFKRDCNKKLLPTLNGFLKEVSNIFYNELEIGVKPLDVVKNNKELMYDWELFSRALKKYYRKSGKSDVSYRKQNSRLRNRLNEEGWIFPEGTVMKVLKMITGELRKT